MCELDAIRALDNFGNALIEVRRLYYAPYAELSAQPECVELLFVFADGSDVTAILPINGLDAAALKKIVPRFHVSRKARGDFEATLYEAIFELHQHAKCGLLQPTEGRTHALATLLNHPDSTDCRMAVGFTCWAIKCSDNLNIRAISKSSEI